MAVRGKKKSAENVIVGGGEMGTLMRGLDWSQTPIGSPEKWPQSLRTAISIMLDSYFPMYIAWGRNYIQFYNDGYRPILGSTKHPAALGLSSKETFAESWHLIGPLFDGVMEGNAVGSEEWMLPLDRHHYLEECFFNYSYSPIREEGGGIGGVLVVVTETTNRVLSERRLRTLRDLAFRTELNLRVRDIFDTAIETFKDNSADIPFALLYAAQESQFEFVGSSDPSLNTHIAPVYIAIDVESGWPLGEVVISGQAVLIDDVEQRFGTFSSGTWPEAITKAIALPIIRLGQEQTEAVLIIGISPRRAFDEDYRNFLTLVTGQIATAVTRANTYEEERKRAEALAELDRAKTEFFSNVSHEFRTPLTLMLNPLQELANEADGVLSEAQRENVEIAHRNSLRLLKLVNR